MQHMIRYINRNCHPAFLLPVCTQHTLSYFSPADDHSVSFGCKNPLFCKYQLFPCLITIVILKADFTVRIHDLHQNIFFCQIPVSGNTLKKSRIHFQKQHSGFMLIVHVSDITPYKQRILSCPEQCILCPEPLRCRIRALQKPLHVTFPEFVICEFGIGSCIYIFFIVHITIFCYIIQIDKCKIPAQRTPLVSAHSCFTQTFLHTVINDTVRCRLIRFFKQKIHCSAQIFTHGIIIIHHYGFLIFLHDPADTHTTQYHGR